MAVELPGPLKEAWFEDGSYRARGCSLQFSAAVSRREWKELGDCPVSCHIYRRAPVSMDTIFAPPFLSSLLHILEVTLFYLH